MRFACLPDSVVEGIFSYLNWDSFLDTLRSQAQPVASHYSISLVSRHWAALAKRTWRYIDFNSMAMPSVWWMFPTRWIFKQAGSKLRFLRVAPPFDTSYDVCGLALPAALETLLDVHEPGPDCAGMIQLVQQLPRLSRLSFLTCYNYSLCLQLETILLERAGAELNGSSPQMCGTCHTLAFLLSSCATARQRMANQSVGSVRLHRGSGRNVKIATARFIRRALKKHCGDAVVSNVCA